jgi:hypothetical protein
MDPHFSGRRMIRIHRLCAAVALAAAAACASGRPAPVPERWVVLREDAGQRASLNVLSIRNEPGDIRVATVAIEYASVQEKDSLRYDHEDIVLRFDCRRGGMRTEAGGHSLGGEMVDVWSAGPGSISLDGTDASEWYKVPPGTYLDDAMKRVCRPEP